MQRTRFTEAINKTNSAIKNNDEKENTSKRNLAEFGSQIYNTEEIEVPAFLRNRSQ